MTTLLAKVFTSRKWVAGLLAFLLPILNRKLGLDLDSEEVTQAIIGIGVVIFGEAYVDGKRVEGVPPPPVK